jgi:hypothetical protein
MAVPLGIQSVRLNIVTESREEWKAQVTDPETGYIARLTTARANAAALNREIGRQNDAIDALEADSAARIAQAERDAAEAQAAIDAALARAGRTLTRPIAGGTVCARVLDVDAAFMAELRMESEQ